MNGRKLARFAYEDGRDDARRSSAGATIGRARIDREWPWVGPADQKMIELGYQNGVAYGRANPEVKPPNGTVLLAAMAQIPIRSVFDMRDQDDAPCVDPFVVAFAQEMSARLKTTNLNITATMGSDGVAGVALHDPSNVGDLFSKQMADTISQVCTEILGSRIGIMESQATGYQSSRSRPMLPRQMWARTFARRYAAAVATSAHVVPGDADGYFAYLSDFWIATPRVLRPLLREPDTASTVLGTRVCDWFVAHETLIGYPTKGGGFYKVPIFSVGPAVRVKTDVPHQRIVDVCDQDPAE